MNCIRFKITVLGVAIMYSISFPQGHGVKDKNSKNDVGNNNAGKGSPSIKSAGADTETVVASATESSDAATATGSARTNRPLITAGKRARGSATSPVPPPSVEAKKVRFGDEQPNDDKNDCIASPAGGGQQRRQGVRDLSLIGSTIFSLQPPIAKQPGQEGQRNEPGSLSRLRK